MPGFTSQKANFDHSAIDEMERSEAEVREKTLENSR